MDSPVASNNLTHSPGEICSVQAGRTVEQLAALLRAVVFIYVWKKALGIRYSKPTIMPPYQGPVINCNLAWTFVSGTFSIQEWNRMEGLVKSICHGEGWGCCQREWGQSQQNCFVAALVEGMIPSVWGACVPTEMKRPLLWWQATVSMEERTEAEKA